MSRKVLASILTLVIFCQMFLTSCGLINPDMFGNNDTGNNVNDSNSNVSDKNEEDTQDKDSDQTSDKVVTSIDVPDRFKSEYTIDRAKLERAAAAATEKLLEMYEESDGKFPKTTSTNYQYIYGANNNWTCGMYTGSYLMAYLLTGDKRFENIVSEHVDSFIQREANRVGMDDHDVGFAFMPSCIGAYKVFGWENARDAAIRAVDYYYDTSYSKEGKFIIRVHSNWDNGSGCRTMIDSMMNASLFYWSGEYLGNSDYSTAAIDHTLTSVDLLVRDDGSTYHHYQFDPQTAKPLYGLTWQGYDDESCWSRGQSWGIYGFSIAYSYTGNEQIKKAQEDVALYMLNNLPTDIIPYWDYTFTSGSEPRDTSAAAIAVCGLLDMAEQLPEDSELRIVYESAAAQLMEALIDFYTIEIGVDYDGLIWGSTHAKPQGTGIEECAPFADYFYMEALARYLCDDFVRPW